MGVVVVVLEGCTGGDYRGFAGTGGGDGGGEGLLLLVVVSGGLGVLHYLHDVALDALV